MFDRDEQEISQILEAGLEAVRSGKASVEDVLKQNPELAQVLRPELDAALWLVSQRERVKPRPGFVMASKKRVMERVRQEATATSKKRSVFGFTWPRRLAMQSIAAIVILVIVFAGTSGIVSASQSALPGETLYMAKRAHEQVSYTLALSDSRKVQLSTQFAEKRLTEAEALMVKGEYVLAKATLEEFKTEVNRATALLQQIDNSNIEQKRDLAVALQNALSQQSVRLDTLLIMAPDDLRAGLEEAQDVSIRGALIVLDVMDVINQFTATPFPTPLPTGTPDPTKTNRPVNTPDVVSPQPGSNDAGGEVTAPSEVPDTDPVETVDPLKTRTPKPTNENRPPKPTEKPPVDPSSKGGGKPSGGDKK